MKCNFEKGGAETCVLWAFLKYWRFFSPSTDRAVFLKVVSIFCSKYITAVVYPLLFPVIKTTYFVVLLLSLYKKMELALLAFSLTRRAVGAKQKRAMTLLRTTSLLVRCIVLACCSLCVQHRHFCSSISESLKANPNLIWFGLDVGWVTEVNVSWMILTSAWSRFRYFDVN